MIKDNDNVISKYKKNFVKDYNPNWFEEVSMIKKVKNSVWRAYVMEGLDGKEIVGNFYKNKFQKTNQTYFRIEKVIKKKRWWEWEADFEWKGCCNWFKAWIDK